MTETPRIRDLYRGFQRGPIPFDRVIEAAAEKIAEMPRSQRILPGTPRLEEIRAVRNW